jgi:hypothetical protein
MTPKRIATDPARSRRAQPKEKRTLTFDPKCTWLELADWPFMLNAKINYG